MSELTVQVGMERKPTDKEIKEFESIFDGNCLVQQYSAEHPELWSLIILGHVSKGSDPPSEEYIQTALTDVLGEGSDWWLDEIWGEVSDDQ